MSIEIYRTNQPPLKGDIVEHNGRTYKVTKVKRNRAEPGDTCIVYGSATTYVDAHADLSDALHELGRSIRDTLPAPLRKLLD